MSLKLYATCISAEIDEDNDPAFVEVFFADEESNTQQYLTFQRALIPDEQDIALRQDKIYIELNGQGCATYGEIEKFVLRNGSAEITLSPETANDLGITRNILIEFSVEPSVFSEFREGLKQLFENEPSILVNL